MAGISHVPFPTLYDVLHVSPRADPAVIKAAYRELQRKHHPDMKAGDTRLSQALSSAYEVLGDETKRRQYDAAARVTKGRVVGNYRILEEIAEGGFGTTYVAKHLIADELVCVKHCHHVSPEHQAILVREAKSIWDLRHFSLPVMRDLVKLDDGSLALVMSYIPGPTIEQLVKKYGRIDPESVGWIAQRILNGLQYLHYHGVVHGDVKPQNIIVQEQNHSIVLVDFGLALVKPNARSAADGHTPVFASPEHLAGTPLVPESDLYSLGFTLLFALCGDINAVQRLQVPKEVPEPFCKFLKRLIVRDVRRRPNWNTEDLGDTLRKVRLEAFGRDHSNMKPVSGY